jgi:hypothetical protein
MAPQPLKKMPKRAREPESPSSDDLEARPAAKKPRTTARATSARSIIPRGAEVIDLTGDSNGDEEHDVAQEREDGSKGSYGDYHWTHREEENDEQEQEQEQKGVQQQQHPQPHMPFLHTNSWLPANPNLWPKQFPQMPRPDFRSSYQIPAHILAKLLPISDAPRHDVEVNFRVRRNLWQTTRDEMMARGVPMADWETGVLGVVGTSIRRLREHKYDNRGIKTDWGTNEVEEEDDTESEEDREETEEATEVLLEEEEEEEEEGNSRAL